MNRFSLQYPLSRAAMTLSLFLVVLAMTVPTAVAQESADAVPAEAPASDLNDFVGSFGPRHITLSNDRLFFQRDGMPTSVQLELIETDTFKILIPPGAQVRTPAGSSGMPSLLFNRDEDGTVISMSLVDEEGTVLSTSERVN